MNRDEIESALTDILVEMFEVERSQVTSEAQLYDDLDLDSIDAVDLIVRLKDFTNAEVEPDRAKRMRTVGDVVDLLAELLSD